MFSFCFCGDTMLSRLAAELFGDFFMAPKLPALISLMLELALGLSGVTFCSQSFG